MPLNEKLYMVPHNRTLELEIYTTKQPVIPFCDGRGRLPLHEISYSYELEKWALFHGRRRNNPAHVVAEKKHTLPFYMI